MGPLTTTPLHPRFGVAVADVDLRRVTAQHLYPEIRALFETHSALLFRGQDLDEAAHTKLSALFGPLENREAMASGADDPFTVSQVSNVKTDGSTMDAQSMRALDLTANQFWHTDSTFLPVPALANLLHARIVPSRGGETAFASTRAGWADLPAALKSQLADATLWHRLSHSRARIDPSLAAADHITRWPDRAWRAVWTNPVTGQDALYIASHAFAVDGMAPGHGQTLIDAAIAHCTTPDKVYTHAWTPGDVIIWDERAVLHRGLPWPMDEPRQLQSICVSATDADGLANVRAG